MTGNPAPVRRTGIRRFRRSQILQHALALLLFGVLVVTGIPQLAPKSAWSELLVVSWGGIEAARGYHRLAGVGFTSLLVLHVAAVVTGILRRRLPPTMIVTARDFRDVMAALRHQVGLAHPAPRFDRFDFKQKYEYWGVLLGGSVMGATGLVLMYPTVVTRLLPGVVVAAAKTAHGYESMLAFSVIVLWHLYSVIWNPEVFPLDRSIFSGWISRRRMRHEHALELERIDAEIAAREKAITPASPPAPERPSPTTGVSPTATPAAKG